MAAVAEATEVTVMRSEVGGMRSEVDAIWSELEQLRQVWSQIDILWTELDRSSKATSLAIKTQVEEMCASKAEVQPWSLTAMRSADAAVLSN